MIDQSPRAANRGRGVTAVLGPTNTGKTHLAIERMLGHESGMIGLPLRLLAREVYDRICVQSGAANVALITGEEKILPKSPRYYVCTVEAMPRDIDVAFVAIDEIQLAADLDRGHVFTRHLLHARGTQETLLLGASTMKDVISALLPDANIISRPRLSRLTYAGQKKISRLPRRSAIVTFTASDVYATAELVRRQRGGAAVVLGALSPKTRNAQVALYQNGEVDFLIATDAIGMGLNLDIDHVAFASAHKYDGRQQRELTNAEIGQISGRAGRHTNDGTFGVTASVPPFDPERITALEDHVFEPVKLLQWRSGSLDFGSIEHLLESLKQRPDDPRLARGGVVDDMRALETASKDERIQALARAPAAVGRLWEVCQIPDYRKISTSDHANLVAEVYMHLMSDTGLIDTDWFAEQVRRADNAEGDIDALANRISHIRTWTFVSHRSQWLDDPMHWQERTRAIEDKLSDALHERLTERFVDRRTSVLMKRLRDKDALNAEIEADGSVFVERHFVGRVEGFHFTPDTKDAGINGKAARHAAARVMSEELSERAQRLIAAEDSAISLTRDGQIMWEDAPVARLSAGELPLRPMLSIIADDHLATADSERIEGRLSNWLSAVISERIKALDELSRADDISGLARGVAFRIVENFGFVKRDDIADDVRQLDQEARGQLRRYGVRFGAFNIFIPTLLKPAASDLVILLWVLARGNEAKIDASSMPEPPREGLTSASANPAIPEAFYRVAGFHLCGKRVVRVDMLERLADMIRPLVAWRKNRKTPEKPQVEADNSSEAAAVPPETPQDATKDEAAVAETEAKPEGATGDGGFRVTPDMMSIVGCSGEEFASVLTELGFQVKRKPIEIATAEAATSEQSSELSPADSGTPTEQQFDEIWRPKRRKPTGGKRPARAKGDRSGNSGDKQRGRAKRKQSGQAGKGHPRSGSSAARRPAKKIDPDSPFAALQGLKKDLESRAKD